jgi:hypothetical protein
MTIEWFRDLVIIIFGLATTLSVLALLLLGILLYVRANNLIKRIEKSMSGPLAVIMAVIQGVRQAKMMMNVFKRKGGD